MPQICSLVLTNFFVLRFFSEPGSGSLKAEKIGSGTNYCTWMCNPGTGTWFLYERKTKLEEMHAVRCCMKGTECWYLEDPLPHLNGHSFPLPLPLLRHDSLPFPLLGQHSFPMLSLPLLLNNRSERLNKAQKINNHQTNSTDRLLIVCQDNFADCFLKLF